MDYREIIIPFDEAENYFQPNNKEILNRLFYKDGNYNKLLAPTTYFLIGDKGSGKTTYAAYFCNNQYGNIKSKRYVISVDDYCKIIQMKREGKLNYTHFTTLWKAIILIKLFSTINDKEISVFGSNAYKRIKSLLEDYSFTEISADSFSPVSFIDNSAFEFAFETEGETGISTTKGISGKLRSQAAEKSTEGIQTTVQREVYYDQWVKFINEVSNELGKLRMNNHHYLFIDGIDTRPDDISYDEYKECVYPLIRAVYDINAEILSKTHDRKKGRLQVILLSRLDIFVKAGLSNPGSKLSDNAALLNWCSFKEKEYQNSEIFRLVNNIFSANARGKSEELSWHSFLDFKVDGHDSFIYLLRRTTCRPRDFVKILKIAKDLCIQQGITKPTSELLSSDAFRRAYSTYYVDAIKTGLSFYYSEKDIDLLFAFLRGFKTDFSYGEFVDSFCKSKIGGDLQKTFGDADIVLKLLFDNNMICYWEQHNIFRWRYRELSVADYNYSLPVEAFEAESKFKFHKALEKELGVYINN